MALLKITETITDLDPAASDELYAGSDLMALLTATRALAVDSLELVGDMANLARQNRVTVTMEVGRADTVVGGQDSAGMLVFEAFVIIPDELAYKHRSSGPVNAYVEQVTTGVGAIFESLPDGGNHLVQALGMQSATVKVATSVIVVAHD